MWITFKRIACQNFKGVEKICPSQKGAAKIPFDVLSQLE
jgi:hypothetical protein